MKPRDRRYLEDVAHFSATGEVCINSQVRRSCRTPIEQQVNLARRLALALALGAGRLGNRVIRLTGERYALVDDELWLLKFWQWRFAINAQRWALDSLGGTITQAQIVELLAASPIDLLIWMLAEDNDYWRVSRSISDNRSLREQARDWQVSISTARRRRPREES